MDDEDSRLQRRSIQRLYDKQKFSVIDGNLKLGDKIVVRDLSPAVDGMLLQTEVDQRLQDSLIFGD